MMNSDKTKPDKTKPHKTKPDSAVPGAAPGAAPGAVPGGGGGNVISNVLPPSELPAFVQSSSPLPPVPVVGLVPVPPEKNNMHVDLHLATDFNQVPEADESDQGNEPTGKSEFPWQSLPPSDLNDFAVYPDSQPDDKTPTPEIPDSDLYSNIMPGTALFSWMKDAVATGGILHRVAEKAKSSVDTMITTLDPQMREYIRSGGDTYIVVASDKDVKVAPIREAFQTAFGKANVVGYPAQSDVTAAQPVGYAAAFAAAKQRIAHVRSTHAELPDNAPVVAIEAFLHEAVPDKWYDISLLVLSQSTLGIELQVQSQGTPVAGAVVAALRDRTPPHYAHRQTGFSETIGAIMAEQLKVPHTQWQEAATGVSRMEILTLAAKSLAVQYKRLIESKSSNET